VAHLLERAVGPFGQLGVAQVTHISVEPTSIPAACLLTASKPVVSSLTSLTSTFIRFSFLI
jgi:hypothetical protein